MATSSDARSRFPSRFIRSRVRSAASASRRATTDCFLGFDGSHFEALPTTGRRTNATSSRIVPPRGGRCRGYGCLHRLTPSGGDVALSLNAGTRTKTG